jgi:hypothetical protein
MLVEIEYPIVTTGIPARSPKRKTVVFKDTVIFDFPEYTAAEAPVALLVPGPQGFLPTEYHGIEGKLYAHPSRVPGNRFHEFVLGLRPTGDALTGHLEKSLLELGQALRTRNSTSIATELYPPAVADHFAKGLAHEHRRMGAPVRYDEVRLPNIEEIVVRDLDMDEIIRQKANFLSHLSEFVVLDGSYYRETPEPVYSVSVGYPDFTTGVGSDGTPPTVKIVKPERGGQIHRTQNTAVVAYFAADRLDDAMEYALAMKATQTDKVFEVERPGEMQVFDPACLTFDVEGETLLVMAEHMAENVIGGMFGLGSTQLSKQELRSSLTRVSTETLHAWKRLTSAMESGGIEELHAVVEECLGMRDGDGGNPFVGFPLTVPMFEAAMRKWADREVALDFTARSGPGAAHPAP